MATEPSVTPAVKFSRRRAWAADQAVGYLMQQAVENPDVVSLAAGLVDPPTLPVETVRAAAGALFEDAELARAALQYGTTEGIERFREHLYGHLTQLEGAVPGSLGIERDQVIVTTGSQQLLSLIGEVLLDPGDICLVSSPTYFVFLGTLSGLGARIVSVPSDEGGMRIDALEQTLQQLDAAGDRERVKLIYVVSYYDNPRSVSLAEPRRSALVELARRWSTGQQIYVIEDAAYRELRYDGPELPSLWSLDGDHDTVVLAQTFSKSFAPGLRIGYGVLPADLVQPLTDRKSNEDFGSASLPQHLLASVFDLGLYQPHVERLRESYRAKRDCLVAAAERELGDVEGVEWITPDGGLYVWMSLPESVDAGFHGKLFDRALHREGVMYVPGDLCYPGPAEQRPRHEMRLSFGVQSLEGLDDGMARLARAIRSVL